jgi:hypothetical protein
MGSLLKQGGALGLMPHNPDPNDTTTPPPTDSMGSFTTGFTPQAGAGETGYTPQAWGEGGAAGNRDLAGNLVYGGYSGMVQNPGYSDAEKNAISTQGQTTARAAFAGARDNLSRNAAITGNRGNLAAGFAQLGKDEATTLGDQARGNTIEFGQEAQRRRLAGLSGAANLYGTETNYMGNLLGQRAALARLQRRTRVEGTGTGGNGGIQASSFLGG